MTEQTSKVTQVMLCWVSPTGELVEVGYGEHELTAENICKERGWKRIQDLGATSTDDYDDFEDVLFRAGWMMVRGSVLSDEAKVRTRNWYHEAQAHELTQAQQDVLFDMAQLAYEQGKRGFYSGLMQVFHEEDN